MNILNLGLCPKFKSFFIFWLFVKKIKNQKYPEYFADIKYTNKLKEIIDSTILNNNGIILYGSYKSGHNNEKYVYTCKSYYDFDGNKYEFTSSFYSLVKLFNARQYSNDIENIKKR